MDRPHGLSFSEALAGHLGEGEEYWSAYNAGRAQGLFTRFRVVVSIAGMEGFLADPEHLAAMTGRVSLAGLGEALPVEGGRLHLFCRREGGTRLLYHLPFRRGDESLLLRGEKRLSGARGAAAWRQMTTLYAELVRPDEGGEVVLRRGVLRIGPGGVAAQALSFRPLGSTSPWRFLRDWARFLRFSSRQIRTA